MGKLTMNGLVPRDDPMFTQGPQLFSKAGGRQPAAQPAQEAAARGVDVAARASAARSPQKLVADLATRLVEKISSLDTALNSRDLAMRKANLLADAKALVELLTAGK